LTPAQDSGVTAFMASHMFLMLTGVTPQKLKPGSCATELQAQRARAHMQSSAKARTIALRRGAKTLYDSGYAQRLHGRRRQRQPSRQALHRAVRDVAALHVVAVDLAAGTGTTTR
jgi:hypothetical protein